MTEGTAQHIRRKHNLICLYGILAMNYSCQWDVLKDSWGCLRPCEQPKGKGAPRLLHVEHNWVSEVFCVSPWWSPSRWHLVGQHLGHHGELCTSLLPTAVPLSPRKHIWAWFSFILQELGWQSCLVPWASSGCQAMLSPGWMEGRGGVWGTPSAAGAGAGAVCTPCLRQPGHQRLLSGTLTGVSQQPLLLLLPFVCRVCGAGWIPALGLLWGLPCCVPDLSSSGCSPVIFQPAFPQAAVQNKIVYPWGLWVCVLQKYTSHHTSPGLLLLLPILALLGRFCSSSLCFCLVFLARDTFWKRAVLWAVSYGFTCVYLWLLSCKLCLKQFFVEQGIQNISLQSGLLSF